MLKRMKVGFKIGFGFAVVLLITLAVSATVITTSLMTAEDIKTVDTTAEFEAQAGTFSNNFYDARRRAEIVYQKTNNEEYELASGSYEQSKATLDVLAAKAGAEASLGVFNADLQQLSGSLDTWKTQLDDLHNINLKLDEIRIQYEAQAATLSSNIYLLYLEQFEALQAAITANASQLDLMQEYRNARSGGEMVTGVHTMRRAFVQLSDFYQLDKVPDAMRMLDNLRKIINTEISEAAAAKNEDSVATITMDSLIEYENYINTLMEEIGIRNTKLAEALSHSEDLSVKVNDLISQSNDMSRAELERTRQTGEMAIVLAAALSGAAVLISLITAFFIVRSITKPIRQMSRAAYELSNGVVDLNELSYRSKDEIGQLSHNMRRMANEIRDVIEGMHQMNLDQQQGEWDARMDEGRFKGAYRELAASSNALAESFIKDLLTVTDCMERFSEGNFNVEIEVMPGRKAVINQAVNGFKNNLQGLSKEIMTLTDSAHQGNLSARADITEYRGGWAEILEQLNTLLYSIIEPVNETSEVISQIAHGHFKMTMQGDYRGDFLLLKENVNGMAKNISGYIYEISHILGSVATSD